MRRKCEILMKKLGIWPNLGGYHYLVDGIRLAQENPECLQHVTKELYTEIAKDFNTSWGSVERSIRTAITICWERGNREFLNEIVGYQLKNKPTSSEFIAIITEYLN